MDKVLFRRYVESREKYQPWIVAFVRNGSKKCDRCIPVLEEVATRCYGYMFVGIVNQDEEPVLTHDYDVKKNWTAFIFNKDGHQKINISCDAQQYYRMLVDNLPNDVLDADPTWLKTSLKKPSVVLFTSRFRIPHMWRAIGGYFKQKGLRVGLCTEQEYIDKFDQVRRLPTVLYMNSTGHYQVKNVHDYKTLRHYIDCMRLNKPPPVKPTVQRSFLTSQFKDECKGDVICVVHTAKSLDPRFAIKETRFSDPRLRFFNGATDIPYSFMKPDEFWIFSGDGKGVIPVDSIQELDDMIKFTIRGEIKYTPIDDYLREL